LRYFIFASAFALSCQLQAKQFVVGVEDISYYPLFDFNDVKPTYTTEMFALFEQYSGYKFKFVPLPVKRFEKWLLEENIDFKYPDNVRWSTDSSIYNKLKFSESTIKLVASTMTLSNKDFTESSRFKTLGTLFGFYPTLWIPKIKSGEVSLYEHPSTIILVRQVLNGHIDGIDLEPSVVNYALSKLNAAGQLTVNRRFTYQVYDYQLSTIKHAEVIKVFNKFLKDKRVELNAIRNRLNIIDPAPYLPKTK
jgi:DNA-binding transcriptional ArsR family regulator